MRRTAMLRRFVMLSISRMAMMRRTAMLRRFVMLSISRMAMACWWASFLSSYSLHSFRQDLRHDFSFPPLGVAEHKAGQDNHKTGEEGSAELHAAAGDTS